MTHNFLFQQSTYLTIIVKALYDVTNFFDIKILGDLYKKNIKNKINNTRYKV